MAKTHRYFIRLSYRGTSYHGWQVQPGSITVQETVENSLSVLLQQKTAVTGCGRTDTGVHARYFIAHFDSDTDLEGQSDRLVFSLNKHLPGDIELKNIYRVPEGAHARFDAISRTYEYHIIRHKDPFMTDLAWYRYDCLSVAEMNKAAEIMMQYTDFSSFSKLHTDVKTNNCKISHAKWFITDNGYIFIIRADRFLRNMVRAITGTMTDVGSGKMSVDEFAGIIESQDRGKAGMSAPARGLYLSLVEYPYPF